MDDFSLEVDAGPPAGRPDPGQYYYEMDMAPGATNRSHMTSMDGMGIGSFDKGCQIVGGAGVALMAIGFFHTALVILIWNQMIAPPKELWVALLLILGAMMAYGAAHLIRGDLFKI